MTANERERAYQDDEAGSCIHGNSALTCSPQCVHAILYPSTGRINECVRRRGGQPRRLACKKKGFGQRWASPPPPGPPAKALQRRHGPLSNLTSLQLYTATLSSPPAIERKNVNEDGNGERHTCALASLAISPSSCRGLEESSSRGLGESSR